VLLAVEDLDALEETIAVLSDPALIRSLGGADAELARGEGEDQKSLEAAMQPRRAPLPATHGQSGDEPEH